MSPVTFADVVHQSIAFDKREPAENLVLTLIDTRWFQRLRDISQTANTRLVYMFSEHSRFGHCLGVAYLAKLLLDSLAQTASERTVPFRAAVLAAAILHDIGHLAPGSHTAFKAWFPDQPDVHESLSAKVIAEGTEIFEILSEFDSNLPELVMKILNESEDIPAWTWQIISGGGWNVDRGNWCVVDSTMAGVSYGKYNIPALIDSIILTPDGNLALRENRLDAMMHFAVSRHAMYRQIYQHRVLLAADMLNRAVVQRARDLGGDISFCDDTMSAALNARSALDLTLSQIFEMREEWWRYHLLRWRNSGDSILSDLSDRLIHRRLFKTVRIAEKNEETASMAEAEEAVSKAGFDPRYYLSRISTVDVHSGDSKQSMLVKLDSGELLTLAEADPLFGAMAAESRLSKRAWIALPAEAKALLGRVR